MKAAALAVVSILPLFGQGAATVVGIGYNAPAPVYVAPGQIVTIFVKGQQSLTETLAAGRVPLPLALGPFQVSLSQTASTGPIPVPILSASPVTECASPIPETCVPLSGITVQIPFELLPNTPTSRMPDNFAALTVSNNGVAGQPIALIPVVDRIHILNSCDTGSNPPSPPCRPDIRHADGTPVTSAKPASPGETLTVLAYGLGRGDLPVSTGTASPSPAVRVPDVMLALRYTAQAGVANSAAVELVPGKVGIYRSTFDVPASLTGLPPCGAIAGNFTVTISRTQSSDSADICVEGPVTPGVGRSPQPRK